MATATRTKKSATAETDVETAEVSDSAPVSAELVYLDPATVKVGANVRTDLPDARDFRRSIKERGVLTPITVYRDEDGEYVCLYGQRRTVEATTVGTPTGTIPAHVVARPDEADRITDQMVENIHRDGMREADILGGVEQLSLLGVSAAQITKRLAVPRPTVNAALAVAQGEQARARVEAGDLTLDQAAILAEFEDDENATARLNQRLSWGHGLEHEAQRLRDEAAERAEYDAEVERLRAEGLPVLSHEDAETARRDGTLHRIANLLTAEGDPVDDEAHDQVPGAQVLVTIEWVYPEDLDEATDEHTEADTADGEGDAAEVSEDDASEDDDEEPEYADPVQVFVPVWVVTDLAASGLRTRSVTGITGGSTTDAAGESEEEAEARRNERRTVIANNKAWTSAETVRREWLTEFVKRKTAPKGAEALICEAVVTGHYSLTKAMEHRHPQLFDLLGIERSSGYYGAGIRECHELAAKPATPKAATMLTLATIVAAWEHGTGKQTWRNPSAWDARVLGALIEWGYQPSEVERLLLGEDATDAA
ncbi:ParB/RepB/Spo0J family partition protein [Nocardioides marmoraquaticus]